MHFLFVAATAAELQAALPTAPAALPEQEMLLFEDAKGRRHGLLITGVGPVNAAMGLGACLTEARKAMAVINVGLAGSFDLHTAPLGSVWHVVREIWPEYGLATDAGVQARELGFPLWRDDAGLEVWDRLNLPLLSQKEQPCAWFLPESKAHALTVAGVTNCRERACRLKEQYGQDLPLLENMEGFALALVCARHGLAMAEVRTVSNLVGSREPHHRAFASALATLHKPVTKLLA